MGRIMTTKQLSEKYQVHPGTVYNWRKKGMPVIKQGGVVRFDEEQVDRWLNGKYFYVQENGNAERSVQ
jgi:excisionase family DNA binding protein